MTASGTLKSIKELLPLLSIASALAAKIGSLGTLKGSFTIITCERLSPGTSTPSQKESVANKTLWESFLKVSNNSISSSW